MADNTSEQKTEGVGRLPSGKLSAAFMKGFRRGMQGYRSQDQVEFDACEGATHEEKLVNYRKKLLDHSG